MSAKRVDDSARPETTTLRRQRARVVTLARALLPTWDGSMGEFCAELGAESGISGAAFRTLFPAGADLFHAIERQLLEECALRVRAVADQFAPRDHPGAEAEVALAAALADAQPLDWSSLTIRLRQRQLAASSGLRREEVIESERAFLPSLVEAFEVLLRSIGRSFAWQPMLAVRVILLTYERSLESWVVSGRTVESFSGSPYVCHTLPQLIIGVSRASIASLDMMSLTPPPCSCRAPTRN